MQFRKNGKVLKSKQIIHSLDLMVLRYWMPWSRFDGFKKLLNGVVFTRNKNMISSRTYIPIAT